MACYGALDNRISGTEARVYSNRVSGMATWYGTVSKRCIKAGRAANGKNKDKANGKNKDNVAITLRKFSNDLDVSMVRAVLLL